jgi:hypothetical protein
MRGEAVVKLAPLGVRRTRDRPRLRRAEIVLGLNAGAVDFRYGDRAAELLVLRFECYLYGLITIWVCIASGVRALRCDRIDPNDSSAKVRTPEAMRTQAVQASMIYSRVTEAGANGQQPPVHRGRALQAPERAAAGQRSAFSFSVVNHRFMFNSVLIAQTS